MNIYKYMIGIPQDSFVLDAEWIDELLLYTKNENIDHIGSLAVENEAETILPAEMERTNNNPKNWTERK